MISIEEIKEKQEELNKMIEEYESQKEVKEDLISTLDKNWKPKMEEKYYFIITCGEISEYFNYNDETDKGIFERTRIFKTKELAEKWLEIDTYLREKSFEPDWKNGDEPKFFIQYNFNLKKFDLGRTTDIFHLVKFSFKNGLIVNKIFKKYTTEELKFYFNIGE